MVEARTRIWVLGWLFTVLLLSAPTAAQAIAILLPEESESGLAYAESLRNGISRPLRVLDLDLAKAAFRSAAPITPFNLSVTDANTIGNAIGCDFFLLLRSAVVRRSASGRPEYYEAYAVLYLVSTRTGQLVYWKLVNGEGLDPARAEEILNDTSASIAAEITGAVNTVVKAEVYAPDLPLIPELPEEGSALSKGFRAPIPYRRIKPTYTPLASFYDVAATVEMVVDLDAKGLITRTEIVRWAGFGLDGSVDTTVRQMNWRPAERDGKPLPMRFLVRYNFKKIE